MTVMLATLLTSLAASAAAAGTKVTIDPAGPGLTYDGAGGLSAGASSRLLIDYAEPARSEILGAPL